MQKRWVGEGLEGLDGAARTGGEMAGQRRDHQALWLRLGPVRRLVELNR
ncbi:hypothetical protein [Rhizobium mongolense]